MFSIIVWFFWFVMELLVIVIKELSCKFIVTVKDNQFI